MGLLESALAQPSAEFGGVRLHKDLCEMAAAYLFHLVQNHPFIDGNKRVGLEAALLFLELNGCSIHVEDDELIDLDSLLRKGNPRRWPLRSSFVSMWYDEVPQWRSIC
jgi:death on curing protein